jgi:hypothetical protein
VSKPQSVPAITRRASPTDAAIDTSSTMRILLGAMLAVGVLILFALLARVTRPSGLATHG